MRIVERDEIPELRTVVVDGEEHNLGILKDFRRHPGIAALIPDLARLSISWVRLAPGEQLEPHVHSIASMIVVAEGQGRTLGDLEEPFRAGDVIAIPAGRHHGFVGAGEDGFWALSVQFEERGLYERPDDPLVTFDGARDGRSPGLARLLRRNAELVDDHTRNPLFALVLERRLDDPRAFERFLMSVQAWSNWFQRAMLLRSAVAADERFAALFREHLEEEFGHDRLLARERGSDEVLWDPVLEATSSWFATSMLRLDDAGKAVLIHLVLEAASEAFMGVAQPVLDSYGELRYFALHNEADEHHVSMAADALDGLSPADYDRLSEVQERGWQMINVLSARIAELSAGADSR